MAGTVEKPSACFLDNTNLRYDLECVHRHAFLGLGLSLPGRSHSLGVSGYYGLGNGLGMAPAFAVGRTLYCAVIHAPRSTVSGNLPSGLSRTVFVLALKSLGSNLMSRFLTTQGTSWHWPAELQRKMNFCS